ncbi:MAG: hypothetical protein IJI71_03550 [Clostridia bacterium]|nr:hypothetical protein [Clostridia bacterium]
MTLALLLTAVTGAWATTDPNSVYWDSQTWKGWAESVTTHTVGDITITCSGNAKAYESTGSGEPLALQAGANDAITFTSNGKPFASVAITTDDELNVAGWTYNSSTWSYKWSGEPTTSVTLSGCNIAADVIKFTFGTAETPITVAWTAATKSGTFSMPGSDVVLTPIYAKAAAFATTGTEPEVKTQLPEAAEGVIAGTDASLIAEGTGIVAFAGESTDVTQGTLMYAIGTSATQAPALTDFSATVPTAKNIADDGADVYVWYYIQGADAPQGEAATLDNTFDNTEPACLTVQVLSNKFDITFNAANANTIEAGKATVTVGGTAATVTDGKLQGVKMGSEVKMTAKEGYKFRKVEVKKKEEAPATPLDNTTTAWTAGTFAVPAGGLTYSDAITVSGNVTLTLTDGETLTLNKGISLASGATLTIQGNGAMVVNGTSGSTASTVAGSTGTLILTSGTLTATGGKGQDMTDSEKTGASGGAAINGSVTVNGGSLTANGGNGGNCIGYAMNVTNGGAGGAAISGDVTITDGAVAATGGNGGNIQDDRGGYSVHGGAGGAAIGGNATLTGGTLTTKQGANGTDTGSNIRSSVGTGGKAVAGTVTNNGGTVNQ